MRNEYFIFGCDFLYENNYFVLVVGTN